MAIDHFFTRCYLTDDTARPLPERAALNAHEPRSPFRK